MEETLRWPVQALPRPDARSTASGIALRPAVTEPLRLLRRPESKGARQGEGDPQRTDGAPPTGPPETATPGLTKRKS